jgi:peptidyl-prolyl cis-trans isomerase C
MVKKVHAEHILVSTEQEANALLSRVTAGESFEKLAEQFSKCPSKKKGGDLGWFGRQMMVREFELAAFDLKKNEVSKPVKTQFGWHIIKVLETG